ncbi:hypothetical protein Lal_00041502 [Lupinus albus]|nr:hypothetical protein Lal_00041502 [Lupinus albus]
MIWLGRERLEKRRDVNNRDRRGSNKPNERKEPSKDVIRVRHLNLFEEDPLLDDIDTRDTCGECTITLEDVSLQLGVNVDGL